MLSPSPAHRLNGERLVVLGWSRAILLQLAHPLIAAGVAEHSSFRAGRLSALSRLHHTVHAMLALTFGTAGEREHTLDVIRAIHRRVHGTLGEPVGPFPAGTGYSAEDPELLLWVHATLLESIPMTYERLVGPLVPGDWDGFCEEAADTVVALGAPRDRVPTTHAALRSYVDERLRSGAIVVGPQAREIASLVLAPPVAASLAAPLVGLNRLITMGLLPPGIRSQYGFRWDALKDRRFDRACRRLRTVRRWLPRSAALWPEARRT
ncbi:MAG: oxygenase MpaB family protein [Vicinamibacterales bacterium]